MTNGSGSGSGSCCFRQWTSRRQQKSFSAYYFWRYIYRRSFFKEKKVIKVTKQYRNQGFSYNFCLTIEGSGSKPLSNGSGSRRPKNTRFLRFRLRIRNTDSDSFDLGSKIRRGFSIYYPCLWSFSTATDFQEGLSENSHYSIVQYNNSKARVFCLLYQSSTPILREAVIQTLPKAVLWTIPEAVLQTLKEGLFLS